jgi:hypothetical protein
VSIMCSLYSLADLEACSISTGGSSVGSEKSWTK